MIREKAKEAWEKITGTDPKSEFEKEALAYQSRYGVTEAAAKKRILNDYLSSLESDIFINNICDPDADHSRKISGGLESVFDKTDLEGFKINSANPAHFRTLSIAPTTPLEARNMESYYKTKFSYHKAPNAAIVRDSSDNAKVIRDLIRRIQADPRIISSSDLEATIKSNRDLGADIGKMLLAKENLKKHENEFGKEVSFEKSMDELKKETLISGRKMVYDVPRKFFDKVTKNFSFDLKAFKKIFLASADAAGKEMWYGTKIMGKAAKTAGHYINKKI